MGDRTQKATTEKATEEAVLAHACVYASVLYARELGTGGRVGSCLPELVEDEPIE